jgi:hypothetical protein
MEGLTSGDMWHHLRGLDPLAQARAVASKAKAAMMTATRT